ncbi:MAG TPA: hypothetical protein VH374_26050 [Polyangia bacterium]|jgi:hypothetical protein|nr:hypothetical protein [Polyangia bacterium]
MSATRPVSTRQRTKVRRPLALALVAAVIGCGASHAADGPPAATSPVGDAQHPPATNGVAPTSPAPPSETVRIVLTVIPSTATAKVLLGKKVLGVVPPRKPLVIVRPRDSGPLDVLVRADGFLPVQTRIYTFADSKLGVKLTAPDDKKTLLGYREPPPPPPPEEAPAVPGAAPVAPAAVPNNEQPPAASDSGAPP